MWCRLLLSDGDGVVSPGLPGGRGVAGGADGVSGALAVLGAGRFALRSWRGMGRDGDSTEDRPRQARPAWPRRVLAVSLAGLVVVAVLLSRRSGTPSLFGIEGERLEPPAHLAVGATLAAAYGALSAAPGGTWRRILRSFAFAAVITTLIEVAQSTASGRAVSGSDAVMNLIGSGIGSLVGAVPGWRRGRGEQVAAIAAVAALVAGVVALQVPIRLGRGCSEVTVAAPQQVPAPDTATMDGLFVYDFEEPDPSLGSPGPFLQSTEDMRLADGRAHMEGDRDKALMVSEEVGEEVSWAVRTGRRFVVDVVATPRELGSEHVPIVAISRDESPSDMNFHIGADGDRLSVRMRMACGQFNWTRIDDVFEAGEDRRITVTVVDSTQRIWVDGVLLDERTFGGSPEPWNDTRNWDLSMAFVIGNTRYSGLQFQGSVDLVRLGPLPG